MSIRKVNTVGKLPRKTRNMKVATKNTKHEGCHEKDEI